MQTIKPIPEGYTTITPYLVVKGAAKAIDFYKKAFGAIEVMRMTDPSGKIMHAEIRISNSPIMLADEFPEMNILSPLSLGGTSISLHLYVEDVDAVANQIIAAGADILKPVTDQFYGDRTGNFLDPFGHNWHIATRKEIISPEELNDRFENLIREK